MDRRTAIRRLATFFLTTASLAHAQQPKKAPRLGYLSLGNAARDSRRAEGIRQALRARGYIDGQNIATEYRYAEGKSNRLPELAAELVRLQVDIIVVAGGAIPVRAAKNSTKTIPIVMTGGGADPVEAGLIDSLARPGGNVTGLTLLGRELDGKRLDLLKETVPKLVSVAVLYNPNIPGIEREVKEDIPAAARALRLRVRSWGVRDTDSFAKVFAELGKQRPGALYMAGGDAVMSDNGKRIADFALKSRLPSMGTSEYVDDGGLMSYGADRSDSYKLVAWYVDKILKGTKPAELPVQRPMKFELMFNLITAKQIGITIPQSILYRADKVIR